jgi:hypothetical protein
MDLMSPAALVFGIFSMVIGAVYGKLTAHARVRGS